MNKGIRAADYAAEKKRITLKQRLYAISFTRIVAGGYFLLLLIGTLLLMLPAASKTHTAASFTDALTTSTSASCVTGLVVFDTFSHWSLFGQLVLLGLIQVGGLGYMTIITLFTLIIGKKIGLRQRGLLKESTNSLHIGGMIAYMKKIIIGTVIFEMLGAVVLSCRFVGLFGFRRGVYYGIFHSVSAFCNAGFDLMGVLEPSSSVTHFKSDPVVLLTLSALIFIGGIGFIVWDDFSKHKFQFKKYTLHSKMALSVSLFLTMVGTVIIFIAERPGEIGTMTSAEGLLNAFFSAVTTRTAGFNSVDMGNMTPASYLTNIMYMLIGGSPGSTAGGMKTTTIAALFFAARANINNSRHINIFGRRLSNDIVNKALTVAMIYFMFVFVSVVLISVTNPVFTLSEVLFEVCSAIGTVGISCGVTGKANLFGQMLITLLMYCGRVGSMSFAMVFTEHKLPSAVVMPEEKIIIG